MEKRSHIFCENLHMQRSVLMGAAILMVCFYHISENLFYDFGVIGKLLSRVHDVCYGGVDIFFFLSGYGAFYSLRRDPDPLRFLARRSSRILWPYLPFLAVWFLLKTRFTQWTPRMLLALLGNVTMTGWLAGMDYQFNWYVQLIFWFYLLAPIFFLWLDRTDAPPRVRPRDIALPALLLLFSFSLIGYDALLGASRLPLFAVGMVFAKYSIQPRRVSRCEYALLYALMVVGLWSLFLAVDRFAAKCWPYGLWWYPYILITPGLCMALASFFALLSKAAATRWIPKGLSLLGNASFEIFLIHVALYDLGPRFLPVKGRIAWGVLFALSCCAGVAYHAVIQRLRKCWERRKASLGEGVGGGSGNRAS